MNSAVRVILGLSGPALLLVSPLLCKISLNYLWLIIPLLCAWAFWLMMEYLRWAKKLGKK